MNTNTKRITSQQVDEELKKYFGNPEVGDEIKFQYKRGYPISGILTDEIENGITLKLTTSYFGRNADWEEGEFKNFDNRVVYNLNCV